MSTPTVRVVIRNVNDSSLEFDLIFEDHAVKPYKLDRYQIRSFRGLSIREIIEHMAKQYYEDIETPVETVNLVFT